MTSVTPRMRGDFRDVGGTGAAEADHGMVPRILALLDQVNPGGRGHRFGDDPMDADGSFNRREAEWFGHLGEGAFGGGMVERHAAA